MKTKTLFAMALFAILLTSCDSFYQGMGGYRGYGGYGYGYNPYAAPLGVLPYWLQPDVYAANAAKQAQAQIQAQSAAMAEGAKRMKEQAEAYAKSMPVAPVYVPTGTTSTSSSSTSSSSSTRSSSSSSSSSKACPQCNGSGKMEYNSNPAQFGAKYEEVYCSTCGKNVPKSWGHSHITCKICHGRGTI